MPKVKSLVVDTSGFVLNKPLWEYGEELLSIQEVFDEIKDVELKNYVLAFPVKVNFTVPKPESINFVAEFSKKTGDFYALSSTDVKVIALTYELEVAANGDSHLRKQPERPKTNTTVSVPLNGSNEQPRPLEDLQEMEEGQEIKFEEEANLEEIENAAMEIVNEATTSSSGQKEGLSREESDIMETDNKDDDSGVEKDTKEDANEEEEDDGFCKVKRRNNKKPKKFKKKVLAVKNSDKASVATSTSGKKHTHLPPGWYDAGDGFEGWLTPENYHLYRDELKGKNEALHYDNEDQELEEEDVPTVACMTGDFAMQNVCRHIGLEVVAPDGKLIRHTKCWVKRCFACFAVTSAMEKLFCPSCGHQTLKRVSMSINEDGSQQIWISSRPMNTRGMIHNIPQPKGGKHAVNALLTEDQRFPHQRPKKCKKLDLMNADVVDDSAPFTPRDVSSAAFAHGNRDSASMGYKGQYMHAKIWRPKRKTTLKK